MADELPRRVLVRIEVPKGSRVKRNSCGQVDYVSPIPCPFNYGSIPQLPSADGEALDAVVLGEALPLGDEQEWAVLGVARFIDAGVRDDKVICGVDAPTGDQVRRVERFFARYAVLKGTVSALLRRGPTRFEGWEPR